MSKSNEPAMPVMDECEQHGQHYGFTKRERACIDLRIPESGDAELDALIEKARRQEVAAQAMQAMISRGEQIDDSLSAESALAADILFYKLERTDG